MSAQCFAVEDPDSLWNFCPSMAIAIAFTILFGLTTSAHLAQAIIYRKSYCWVLIMGGTWHTFAYIFRIISILHPTSLPYYAVWFVLVLVSPLWTNAFVYMVMGRMVWNYISNAKIFGLTAWRFGLIFVLLDISAAIVQIYGAASASTGDSMHVDEVLQALHIYMGGVGVQQAFILVFAFFAYTFHRTLLSENYVQQKRPVVILLSTLYAVLALISMRIVFRLCEYSNGLTSTIPNHEAYMYCLDSLPMLLALIFLNVVHPGRVMAGKDCDLPSRKERKRNKITSKSERQNAGSTDSAALD